MAASLPRTPRSFLLRAAMLVSLLMPLPAVGAPGDLDPTFGTGGVVTLPIAVHSYANALAIQPDGKIVLAGYAYTSGDGGDMAVVRLDAAGALDPGFGTGGLVTLPAGVQSIANAVVLQPDGAIVVGGGSFVAADVFDYDFRLARLLPGDGQPDPAFGTGGVVVTPAAGTTGAVSLALQPDGAIVVGGDGKRKVQARSRNRDFVLTRHLGDGSLDSTFGSGGRAVLSMGKRTDVARRVLVQPDGKILAAGYATGPGRGGMVVARVAADGKLDGSFAAGGRRKLRLVTRLEYAEDAALLADGRVLVAGLSVDPVPTLPAAAMTLFRLTTGGRLDTNFGAGGFSSVAPDAGAYHHVRRIAVQPDGKIVAAGSITLGSGDFTPDVFLARLLGNGTLDASFGTGGIIRTSFTTQDELFDVALQTDGAIVVAGVSVVAGQSRMLVARYLP
jgi:uncharacterized delta-60 repeat protein